MLEYSILSCSVVVLSMWCVVCELLSASIIPGFIFMINRAKSLSEPISNFIIKTATLYNFCLLCSSETAQICWGWMLVLNRSNCCVGFVSFSFFFLSPSFLFFWMFIESHPLSETGSCALLTPGLVLGFGAGGRAALALLLFLSPSQPWWHDRQAVRRNSLTPRACPHCWKNPAGILVQQNVWDVLRVLQRLGSPHQTRKSKFQVDLWSWRDF